jgi:hypothetical protein
VRDKSRVSSVLEYTSSSLVTVRKSREGVDGLVKLCQSLFFNL